MEADMQANVGVFDSTLRIAIGFALLGLGFIVPAPLKYLAFAGFLLLAVTGFAGKCLLYRVLGISTLRPCDRG
jgi:hypothetical protein